MKQAGLVLLLASAILGAPPARIVREKDTWRLLVDGQPFLILGAQLHNSSAWPSQLERIWPQIHALGANTVEAPVYWEALEPEPGRYDFTNVDAVVLGARQQGLRAILLWFGTWKNGAMDYAPEWVKTNPDRYWRVRNRNGEPLRVLSPHCTATREADAKAFAALMKHLREVDEQHGTVLMVQVENEPGILGSDRDYSPEAEKLFKGERHESPEAFNAHHTAAYINFVASAGKAEYPLPMYVNVWLREGGWERAGETYPSGGAVSTVLDVWKKAAPDIDFIAPDIYLQNVNVHRDICDRYSRPDNPLFIPESGGSLVFARYMFHALAGYGAIGFAPFGVDTATGTELDPRLRHMAANFRLIQPLIPVLATHKLRYAVEDELRSEQLMHLGSHDLLVRFRTGGVLEVTEAPNALERAGRLFIIETAPHEFVVAGFSARLEFRPVGGRTQYLSVEEGNYERGVWRATRRLNGDEVHGGLTLTPSGTVLKVRLMTY